MKRLSSGFLVAIEGIDGTGKTTLAQTIASFFNKNICDTLLTKEPGGTLLGQKLRVMLQEKTAPINSQAEYLLFAADRAQHFSEIIAPALTKKMLVISDRMADSSLAYQGYGRGLDLAMIAEINNWAMNTIKPHLTLYLDLPLEKAFERLYKRGTLSSFEKKQFIEQVLTGFNQIYKNRSDVIKLDAHLSPEDLATLACNKIKSLLPQ